MTKSDKLRKQIQLSVGRAMGEICKLPGYVATEGVFSIEDGKVHIDIDIKETEPKTIYAGTEDYVEFFKLIADTFGISEDSYSIEIVDGEYEINVLV